MSNEIPLSKNQARENLIRELGPKLVQSTHVQPPAGLSTGWSSLDRFLLWNGFPKGSLSLLIQGAGGATTLWERSAALITRSGQWVAWIDNPESVLTPWSLKKQGADLSKLLSVAPPGDTAQLLWALQELMSLSLFEMIGCDLGPLQLKEHQLLKLKKLALRYQTALVFTTASKKVWRSSSYALVLNFQRDHVTVDRALHRPTPHNLERKELYADTLPLLASGRRALCG